MALSTSDKGSFLRAAFSSSWEKVAGEKSASSGKWTWHALVTSQDTRTHSSAITSLRETEEYKRTHKWDTIVLTLCSRKKSDKHSFYGRKRIHYNMIVKLTVDDNAVSVSRWSWAVPAHHTCGLSVLRLSLNTAGPVVPQEGLIVHMFPLPVPVHSESTIFISFHWKCTGTIT